MEPPPQVTPASPAAAVAAPAAAAAHAPTAPSAAGVAPFSSASAADGAAYAFAAANHKRKLEDLYRSSKYFVIRSIVKDLRPSVIEVLQAPDIKSSKAAEQMQIIMKFMMELLKEMKAESPFSSEHNKKVKEEGPPLSGASADVPRGKPQGGESYASAEAQAGEIHVAAVNATVSAAQAEKPQSKPEKGPEKPQSKPEKGPEKPQSKPEKGPEKPQSKPEKGSASSKARNKSCGTENVSVSKEIGKEVDGERPSYIVGGSPVGWNFLLYPGGEVVYYGVTKASARLRQAAK